VGILGVPKDRPGGSTGAVSEREIFCDLTFGAVVAALSGRFEGTSLGAARQLFLRCAAVKCDEFCVDWHSAGNLDADDGLEGLEVSILRD
jgi:hypothetical protein